MQVSDHLSASLLEGAPDAMVCVAENGQVVLVNAQAERLFGYRREELVGRPVEILVPDAAKAPHVAYRARYLADPKTRVMGAAAAFSCLRRDGSTFPAEISLSVIDTGDGRLVMAAVRDVAERLELQAERERLRRAADRDRMEAQLQQSRRLESLGELAGGVAHDFNNLLAVISNYAAFVGEELAKAPVQANWTSVRDDVRQIERAAERGSDLTHQLLAFARRDVVQPRPLNLNEVIADVKQMLVRTLGEHVVLKTELAPELCPVLADPGQLEQVLANLAVNARDAMPGGGSLTVTTVGADVDAGDPASLAGLAPGRYACLTVGDTGVGMSKEVLDHAFEPFFTTKPKGQGTGLGLATVYGIIMQARGHVQVSSEPGNGTTFTILLPATGRGAVARQEPERARCGGAGETVLVVEDEPAMRDVTRRILSRNGYHVITASGGHEAIDIAANRADAIDVVLTDVVMPRMLGNEAAERIRELRPSVKVVFMSGYTHGVLDTQGVVAAGVNLIEKPFTEKSLLAKLREVIAGDEPGRCR
jgi:PAS domain S-box-containing protein